MKIEFIPIDYDYFDWQGRNFMRIIGRDSKGRRICVVDEFEASFWAIFKEGASEKRITEICRKIEKLEAGKGERVSKVEGVDIMDKEFMGKKVRAVRIKVTNYKDAHAIADQMGWDEIEKRREYDIPLVTKYVMDRELSPLIWHEIEGDEIRGPDFGGICEINVDLCIKVKRIKKIERAFEPRILAFDLEASEFELGKGEVLMISLCGKNLKKVLTWKKCSVKQDYVECFSDEEEMLEKFVEYVHNYSPDLLVGYFSDGFDLPYLKERASRNKIRLPLGLDGGQPSFSRGRIPSGSIFGIVHVDLFRFIETAYSQYLQSETLSLNEVACELLGDKKCDFDFARLKKMAENDWRDFFEYNMKDSCLTYQLAEKIWPDMMEFSKVIQEPLFDVTRDGMSTNVENYILHNLKRFNEIAEKRPLHDEIAARRSREKYEGAFVFQPTPGLYENLAFFDFTSMHASIIVTHNLSKATLLPEKEKGCFESPEVDLNGQKQKFYFSNKKGFYSALLEEVVELRKKYKKELKDKPDAIKKARSNAFKLLANAYYGYTGFFGARYYSIEAAASTLAFVRKFNKEVIEKTNKKGYTSIYADTDSVAFTLNGHKKQDALNFLGELNQGLPGIMELELEDFYKRGIWVTKRTGDFGAKKKYALITEDGKMKIRGFETVRRDWCRLARTLQSEILGMILKDGNEKRALEFIRKTIREIKERKIDRKQLIIRTQLKKPISEYKSISPHVVAAQKMIEAGIPADLGMLIEYFISETREKKALVREKVKLPDEKGEYNIDYYLNHQILPAVENILEVFGINISEVIDGNKQKKLF
jgi:DNA polymerase I/DNA polymerase-2